MSAPVTDVLERPEPPPEPSLRGGQGAAPDAKGRPAAPANRTVIVARVLTATGGLLLLFLVFVFFVSSLPQARNQAVLLAQFQTDLNAKASTGTQAAEDSGLLTADSAAGGAVADKKFDPAPRPPVRGEPIAVLQIPAIEVQQVVVEGTGPAELRSGPGHYRATPLPGEPGNVAIAGPRTTNGAPFRNLDQLAKGDEIKVATSAGTFRYKVDEVAKIVPGEDPDPTQPLKENRLTVLTSSPPYRGSERLMVTAKLDGKAVRPPTGRLPVGSDERTDGFSADTGALTLALLWGQLLALCFIGTWWLYSRWHAWTVWLLTTPVLLALLFLFYENLAGVLPATL